MTVFFFFYIKTGWDAAGIMSVLTLISHLKKEQLMFELHNSNFQEKQLWMNDKRKNCGCPSKFQSKQSIQKLLQLNFRDEILLSLYTGFCFKNESFKVKFFWDKICYPPATVVSSRLKYIHFCGHSVYLDLLVVSIFICKTRFAIQIFSYSIFGL